MTAEGNYMASSLQLRPGLGARSEPVPVAAVAAVASSAETLAGGVRLGYL